MGSPPNPIVVASGPNGTGTVLSVPALGVELALSRAASASWVVRAGRRYAVAAVGDEIISADLEVGRVLARRSTQRAGPGDPCVLRSGRVAIAALRGPEDPTGVGITVLDPATLEVVFRATHAESDGQSLRLRDGPVRNPPGIGLLPATIVELPDGRLRGASLERWHQSSEDTARSSQWSCGLWTLDIESARGTQQELPHGGWPGFWGAQPLLSISPDGRWGLRPNLGVPPIIDPEVPKPSWLDRLLGRTVEAPGPDARRYGITLELWDLERLSPVRRLVLATLPANELPLAYPGVVPPTLLRLLMGAGRPVLSKLLADMLTGRTAFSAQALLERLYASGFPVPDTVELDLEGIVGHPLLIGSLLDVLHELAAADPGDTTWRLPVPAPRAPLVGPLIRRVYDLSAWARGLAWSPDSSGFWVLSARDELRRIGRDGSRTARVDLSSLAGDPEAGPSYTPVHMEAFDTVVRIHAGSRTLDVDTSAVRGRLSDERLGPDEVQVAVSETGRARAGQSAAARR